jgi:hypothetical protein
MQETIFLGLAAFILLSIVDNRCVQEATTWGLAETLVIRAILQGPQTYCINVGPFLLCSLSEQHAAMRCARLNDLDNSPDT